MALFPYLEIESTLQVNDKTRIDATKSYVSKGEAALTSVEIDPGDGSGFVSVFGTSSDDWYLDYEYSTDGDKTVQVRIDNGSGAVTRSGTISVLTVANDKLFSADSDLTQHEADILKWVPEGRNSFLNIHRRSQEMIIAWLDEKGYIDIFAEKFTKEDIGDIDEVKQWSIFMTLRLIFEGISNAVDDVFALKAQRYSSEEIRARHRAVIRIDIDGDGTVDDFEDIHIHTGRIWRR